MMEQEMQEMAAGTVSIGDSDPDYFPDFLHYLYTGSVDNLTSESVLYLYSTGDKYQVNELKRLCVEHMKNNISTENFCDVLILSLQHHESELSDVASQFFLQNYGEIVSTVKWQMLLSETPESGKELIMKLIRAKKQCNKI